MGEPYCTLNSDCNLFDLVQDHKVKWWAWLLSSYTAPCWLYAVMQLSKTLWMTAVVEFSHDKLNGALSLIVQTVDTCTLLYLRPFNDILPELSKNVGETCNLATYCILTLPMLLGLQPPEWIGDKTKIVVGTLATAVAAFVAVLSPLDYMFAHFTKVLQKFAPDVYANCICCCAGAAPGIGSKIVRNESAYKIAVGNAVGEVQTEIQDRIGEDQEVAVDQGSSDRVDGGEDEGCLEYRQISDEEVALGRIVAKNGVHSLFLTSDIRPFHFGGSNLEAVLHGGRAQGWAEETSIYGSPIPSMDYCDPRPTVAESRGAALEADLDAMHEEMTGHSRPTSSAGNQTNTAGFLHMRTASPDTPDAKHPPRAAPRPSVQHLETLRMVSQRSKESNAARFIV